MQMRERSHLGAIVADQTWGRVEVRENTHSLVNLNSQGGNSPVTWEAEAG